MSKETLRLRIFAGPNGSGKSTFKSIIRPELLGIFINPDEIEKQIQDYDFLDLEVLPSKIDRKRNSGLFYQFSSSKNCGFVR
ncbi:MAG TPA: hypothetical protein VHZ76_01335 [Gammaproteobacteria bacterium]|jgi:predicted ABC-type ATPase|nr:hypothetical protein [Gammaproteobacteria bacterium]